MEFSPADFNNMAASLNPLMQSQTSSCPADPCSHQQHLRAIGAHPSLRLSTLSKGAVAAN